ncbi:hypothetical protein EDB80DRAFT_875369 [Ilyonectria destructans]|nr:hypothetical protein EDB80DRAFT_875369 [Ilyonectria destructans]
MLFLFFYPSESSLALGNAWWKRIQERKDIEAPTLITNGHRDVMSPTPNSFVLQQNIENAHLIIYPDAGHGHLFQVPELYAQHLQLFLDGP